MKIIDRLRKLKKSPEFIKMVNIEKKFINIEKELYELRELITNIKK